MNKTDKDLIHLIASEWVSGGGDSYSFTLFVDEIADGEYVTNVLLT